MSGDAENCLALSSPARGTWIEIVSQKSGSAGLPTVVPRKGDVDRNRPLHLVNNRDIFVVPRKGDVDRNFEGVGEVLQREYVVPRKGDVDRNFLLFADVGVERVVPRKGDVDRNAWVSPPQNASRSRPPQGGRG